MMAGIMAWEILWALILGFTFFAVIQAVVSKEEMSNLLPDDSPRTIILACGLGSGEFILLLCCSGAGAVHVSQRRFAQRSRDTAYDEQASKKIERASTQPYASFMKRAPRYLYLLLRFFYPCRFTAKQENSGQTEQHLNGTEDSKCGSKA